MLGTFPTDSQAQERPTHRSPCRWSCNQSDLEADLGGQWQTPEAAGKTKIAGARWRSSRNCGNASSGILVRSGWGRQDSFLSTSRPASLKPLMTLRTVWSSQPNCRAIALACSRRSLAKRIWQRRRTKALDERNLFWMLARSSSVRGRMKMGAFILFHIGNFPTFFRTLALGASISNPEDCTLKPRDYTDVPHSQHNE
jgi:hypothetical protein